MTDPKKTMSDAEKRADGYTSMITQMGTSYDKSRGTFFISDRILEQTELAEMYEQDPIAARVIDRLVDDATRVDFNLVGLDQGYDFTSVKSELEDLQAVKQIGETWRWARLYGGALLIMGINDGNPYDQPLDLSKATRLSALSVVDSTNVIPVGFIPGLGSRAFSNPDAYQIIVPFGEQGGVSGMGKSRTVHKSRVIRIDGFSVPAIRMIQNGGWGPSYLQRVWKDIRRLGSVLSYAENVMHEISTMVLNIEGLRDMLCGSEGGEGQVKQLLETLKWGVDVLHVLALDKEDSFTEVKRSVDGIAVLIDRFVDALVRSTNMPRLILLGEQPSGLNANSEGEIRAWYDSVSSEQKQVMTPALNRLMTVLMRVRQNRGEQVPDEWTIEYESLVQESPERKSDLVMKAVQAAQILVSMGVATPAEIRAQMIEAGIIKPLETPSLDVSLT